MRTGENAFAHAHGTDVWHYRAAHLEESAVFDRAMSGISRGVAEALIASYDFAAFACVVDVGGSQGALLAAVLAHHPALRGILFDQPHVVAGRNWAQSRIAARSSAAASSSTCPKAATPTS